MAELAGLLEEVGRSRAWVYDQLDDLEGEGVISRAGGYPVTWHILAAA